MASLRAWTPLRHSLGLERSPLSYQLVRHASLNSAIERGRRRSQRDEPGGSNGRDQDQDRSERGQDDSRKNSGDEAYNRRERISREVMERLERSREKTFRDRRSRAPQYEPGKPREKDLDGRRRDSRMLGLERRFREEDSSRREGRSRMSGYQAGKSRAEDFGGRRRDSRAPDQEGRGSFRADDHSRQDRRPRTPDYQSGRSHDEDYDGRRRMPDKRRAREEANSQPGEFDEEEFIKTGSLRRASPAPELKRRPLSNHWDRNSQNKPRQPKKRIGRYRAEEGKPERIKENVLPPSSIPYSSSASEFVYGTNAVEAAIRCGRRKLYVLYLYQNADEDLSPAKISLRKLAFGKDVRVKMAFGRWSGLMDQMSGSRPHNGCILEASPLPQLPVLSFKEVLDINHDSWSLSLGPQSAEEAAVNGTADRIVKASQHRQRYPVVLLLDGIVDPGNLGAIIRSAYFLGIDGIAFAGRNSAPLSPVAIKASAGAAENMPFFKINNEVAFIKASRQAGWRFYAADAPGPAHSFVDPRAPGGSDFVTTAPSVIMLGSEASGLNQQLTNHADTIVSIPGLRHGPSLGVESDPARVDSLNVSVAAALLLEMFMGLPLALSTVSK